MQEVFEKITEKLESEAERWEDSGKEYEDRCEIAVARGIKNAIEIVKQEAEQYNNGWISCSESFPEESGTYIVNAIENHIVHVTFAKWMPRMKRWNLTGNRSYWKVTAWQPLPEPYRGE